MATETPADKIAGNVRAAMAARRISGRTAAAHLGMNQSAFSRRYKGDTEWRADELLKLAEILGVAASTLIEGDGLRSPAPVEQTPIASAEQRLAAVRGKAFRLIRDIERIRDDLASLTKELDQD